MKALQALMFGSLPLLLVAGAVQAQDVPEGPGSTQFQAACSVCHATSQATSMQRTEAQWADTVDQMIARGATVSDEDYPMIVKYLAAHFGPPTSPAAATAAASTAIAATPKKP